MATATKVRVTVTYETEYQSGKTLLKEEDIDINDVIRDTDNIKDIKVHRSWCLDSHRCNGTKVGN